MPPSWRISSQAPVVANRGMIARHTIEKGSLILEEDALVTLYTGYGHRQWGQPINTFWADERAGTTNRLQTAFNSLTATQRGHFNQLFRPGAPATPLAELVDRFEHNALNYNGSSNMYLAVYRYISAINHSCFPNAKVDMWEGSRNHPVPQGQARLVATRSIPAGEEIFLNYVNDLWLDNHTIRNNELQTHYHFTCTCTGCTVVGAAGGPAQLDAAERATARIYSTTLLSPAPALSGQALTTHIDRLHTFIRMLSAWGKWDEDLSEA